MRVIIWWPCGPESEGPWGPSELESIANVTRYLVQSESDWSCHLFVSQLPQPCRACRAQGPGWIRVLGEVGRLCH